MSRGDWYVNSSEVRYSKEDLFRFTHERIRIWERRQSGQPWPWTHDPILRDNFFPNIDRREDPGTIYCVENILKKFHDNADFTFFNVVVYRLFNRISTAEVIGTLDPKTFDHRKLFKKLNELRKTQSIFTKAHQTTPKFNVANTGDKVKNYCILLDHLSEVNSDAIWSAPDMVEAVRRMKQLPGFSDFTAYQVCLDISYLNEFSPMNGPRFLTEDSGVLGDGSRYGLMKIFGKSSKKEELDQVQELSQSVFSGLRFCDVENALCEFSKYVRIKEGQTKSPRKYHRKEG
jgi:hypothetical protein